ncbi:hypothetical protein BGW39_002442, partial [Mortierella sp. 14UC]
MVEGKVQDLSRVMDQEPLLALLGQLATNSDPYLKYQAAYAQQTLLHIPNDETRWQFMLQQAGNIAMGLLGVSSVCKLDASGFSEGSVEQLCSAMAKIFFAGSGAVHGAQEMLESGCGIVDGVKGGPLVGEMRLWYCALLEAQEHIRNGRLADFNHLVFEVPCRRDTELQWGVCQMLGDIADIATRQYAVDFLAKLYRNKTCATNEGVDTWILQLIRQVAALPESAISDHAQPALQDLKNEGNDPVDRDYGSDSNPPSTSDLKAALSLRSFVKEPSVLMFLAERVDFNPIFEDQLFDMIVDSKKDEMAGVAAANAISILVKASGRFNSADLHGIRIRGADLFGGEFGFANLFGADL